MLSTSASISEFFQIWLQCFSWGTIWGTAAKTGKPTWVTHQSPLTLEDDVLPWIQFIRYPSEIIGGIMIITTVFNGLFVSAQYQYMTSPAINFGDRLDAIVVGYVLWTLALYIVSWDLMARGEGLDISLLGIALMNGAAYFTLGLIVFGWAERQAKRKGIIGGY